MACHHLLNSSFSITLENGFPVRFEPGKDIQGEKDTCFVLDGYSFGAIQVRTGNNAVRWYKNSNDLKELKTDSTSLHAVYSTKDGLSLHCDYTFQEETAAWTFGLRNEGSETVVLEDLGVEIPCSSVFEWGKKAANQVIGHHYIGANGSHFIFKRCDGKGPRLMLLPVGDAAPEYCTRMEECDNKGGYVFWLHSSHIRQSAEKNGAKIHIPATSTTLAPGETKTWSFVYLWADCDEDTHRKLITYGMADIRALPGLTVPIEREILLAVGCTEAHLLVLPNGLKETGSYKNGAYTIHRLMPARLGEHTLRILTASGRFMIVTLFVTEAIETLLRKRRDFIASHQHRDPGKWYFGLLAEHNNETGALLGPDNYDRIGGWRIYEVSCDDPGLSKPAFLSSCLVELPDASAAQALDLYVEHFVWGGLQRTEDETYPYAIYGIPDWHCLRNSPDPGKKGQMHLWRIYDYPHLILMYHSLYRIRKQRPDLPLSRTADEYLERAYRTAVAMFTIPLELDEWSAFETGLYNELVIENVISDLGLEGKMEEKEKLEALWNKKALSFLREGADLFGSEYPFDTTGFESTHALAKRAAYLAKSGLANTETVNTFMENQIRCNIACRGSMEPLYWLYGSDYRGNVIHYTLSYMSQMGGWSILDHALYIAKDPYAELRLGYGSALSSWALLNSGTAESGYGWRFPGKEHDGAASGGFEPLYEGETWLNQPHHGGAWYYSCEIDLGFCGYLREAAAVLADDPIFGCVTMGGRMRVDEETLIVTPEDGIRRRFHMLKNGLRLHLVSESVRFTEIRIDLKKGKISVYTECDRQMVGLPITLVVQKESNDGPENIYTESMPGIPGEECTFTFPI